MSSRFSQITRPFLLLIGISALICYACRKDTAHIDPGSKIAEIKKAFESHSWASRLTNRFNDSLSITWSPDWDHPSQKTTGGAIFYYIRLTPGLSANNNPGKHYPVTAVSFQEYLIVRSGEGDDYLFQRASYIRQTPPVQNGRSSNSNADMNMDYNRFTGHLILKDFTGSQQLKYYQNGELFSGQRTQGNYYSAIEPIKNRGFMKIPDSKDSIHNINLDSLNPWVNDPSYPVSGDFVCSTACFSSMGCGSPSIIGISRTKHLPMRAAARHRSLYAVIPNQNGN